MKYIRRSFAILIYALLVISLFVFIKNANAFSCTSNGLSIGGGGTFTIPVNVELSKSTTMISLTDMSRYTTCTGDYGTQYQDALRTTGATLSPTLSALGFTGVLTTAGIKYNFPGAGSCLWPNSSCTISPVQNTGQVTTPLNVQIGMERAAVITGQGATIPAGSEIARLSVQQRSQGSWGWNKTWIFTTINTIYIPAYTCQIDNPNQTVVMPPVNLTDIKNNGTGRYPAMKGFNIALTCDPHTVVSMQFAGTSMQGHNDVLANSDAGNNAIGIQVMYNNAPVILGVNSRVISDAQAQEILAFNAAYYFNGDSALHAGPVSSVATVTFTYN